LVPFCWDNGYTGNFGLGLFNRSTGASVYRDIITSIINAADTTNTSTSVETPRSTSRPAKLSLMQNYPNPFNPSTSVSFELPSRAYVSLKVFDVLGKEVATIVSEEMPAGSYTRIWEATGISSGVYFYRLRAGLSAETKKFILLR
jgi:hypothetical protein